MGVSGEESTTDQHQKVLLQFRYQIQRYLGYGGGGLVYLAVDGHKGNKRRQVAIKVVRFNNPLGEGEWRYWSRLHHPNIVHLLAKFEVSGDRFYVMEYAANGTLFEWMRRHRTETGLPKVSETRARRWMRQLLETGRYCHHLGLYHFDIKSSNILLDGALNIKLADFGTMKFKEEEVIRHNGCRFYRPPEVLRSSGRVRGISALEAVDVWAIGATLLRFLSGGKLISYRDFTDSDSERKSDILLNIRRNVIRVPTLPLAHDGARPLLVQMLQLESRRRPSCATLLKHPWLATRKSPRSPADMNVSIATKTSPTPIKKPSKSRRNRRSPISASGKQEILFREDVPSNKKVSAHQGDTFLATEMELPGSRRTRSRGVTTEFGKTIAQKTPSPQREVSKISSNSRKGSPDKVRRQPTSPGIITPPNSPIKMEPYPVRSTTGSGKKSKSKLQQRTISPNKNRRS